MTDPMGIADRFCKYFTIRKFSAPTIAFLAFWLAKKNSDYEPIVGVLRHMENSTPSLKIFRSKFSTSALCNGRNKNRRQNPIWEFTETMIPFALVGYDVIITNSRYALVSYFITSYPTRAHGIIVIYWPQTGRCYTHREFGHLSLIPW